MNRVSLPGWAGALAARGVELPGLRSHRIAARSGLVLCLDLVISTFLS